MKQSSKSLLETNLPKTANFIKKRSTNFVLVFKVWQKRQSDSLLPISIVTYLHFPFENFKINFFSNNVISPEMRVTLNTKPLIKKSCITNVVSIIINLKSSSNQLFTIFSISAQSSCNVDAIVKYNNILCYCICTVFSKNV